MAIKCMPNGIQLMEGERWFLCLAAVADIFPNLVAGHFKFL
jgi:hypothetical protein